jgi:hypothetical protein
MGKVMGMEWVMDRRRCAKNIGADDKVYTLPAMSGLG